MGYLRETIEGIYWIGLLRVTTRFYAFIKIAILARILLPEQFGIFGVATLTLSFLQLLFESGISIFFIQNEGRLKEFVNSAWVITIGRGLIIGSLLLLFSSPLSTFFYIQNSVNILRLIAIVPIISGFVNPAVIIYLKSLQFKKEFLFRSIIYITDASVAIVFSMAFKNAYGLVLGLIAGSIAEVIMSFVFFKPHPKFQLEVSKAKKIISRGKWVALSSFFDYLYKQGDDIVVGRLLNVNMLGIYQNAYKISSVPVSEVADLFGSVTFPILSHLTSNRIKLKRAFIQSFFAVSLLSVPICLILYFFPRQVVLILLGQNWLDAVGVIKILALFGLFRGLMGPVSAMFLALRKQEYVAATTLISAFVMLFSIIPAVNLYGINGAATAALIGSLAPWPLAIYLIHKSIYKNQ